MSGSLKVVEFSRTGFSDPVQTLRTLADQLESGALQPCDVGVLALLDVTGGIEVFGFGPKALDLQCIAVLRLAEHRLSASLLALNEEQP